MDRETSGGGRPPEGLREGPRERLQRHGVAVLSDAELLGLLLGAAPGRAGGALGVGEAALAVRGDLRRVVCGACGELAEIPGVGPVRAAQLIAAGEIARRLEARELTRGAVITQSNSVHAHFGPLLADERREYFYAVLLDTKNRVISNMRISEGSLGASIVHPREAFRPALREAAASVIFVHNHPSGDSAPSMEDRRITTRLRDAGELLGIPVLDHVIVGRREYYSFADEGW